jgi:2',3'-cyclic-nucleotide 2'-phosphodiesterase (5'-nucleotidase family)
MMIKYWCRFLAISVAAVWSIQGLQALEEPPSRGVTLFFNGYVRGNFQPCGCKSNPSGGLARRFGYIDSYRKKSSDEIINVELGAYLTRGGKNARRINRFMLEALNDLPVHIFHLNAWDLPNRELIEERAKKSRIISSNLTLPADKGRPFRPIDIRKIELSDEASVRIGFIGLSNPRSLNSNAGYSARNPLKAAESVLGKHGEKADYWVVLTDLSAAAARELAEEHPEICSILIMSKRYRLAEPIQVKNAVLLQSIERGRYLGQLRLIFDQKAKLISYEPKFINLNEGITDDEEMSQKVKKFTEELKNRSDQNSRAGSKVGDDS